MKALVIGGTKGIGLCVATELTKRQDIEKVYIIGRSNLSEEYFNEKFEIYKFDVTNRDYSFFEKFIDVDILFISSGFGNLKLFSEVSENEIYSIFEINTIATIRIVKFFYSRLMLSKNFYCGIMVSISGFMSSPFFSLYSSSKAALKIFIESVNVELKKGGSNNLIMNVSPGYIKGTSFDGGRTNLSLTKHLANDIIINLFNKNDLYIPNYDDVYKNVLERYYKDFRAEGEYSYEYKLSSGRIKLS